MIHRFPSLLILFALLPGMSLAQSTDSSEAELIPRYDVEIIVFKNIKVPRGREFVLPVSSPGKDDATFDLSSEESIEAGRENGYELLTDDGFRLLDLVTRLIESPRYELLLHAAWRQPGLERERVLPIWIKGGQIYGNEYTSIDSSIEPFDGNQSDATQTESEVKTYEFDEQTLESQELLLVEEQETQQHNGLYELEGKITIVLSRYLHTYVDLILRRPRLLADPVLDNAAEEEYLAAHLADTHILNNHPLREHRRMRSKNLHYIDNPEFGMLVLITPYEVPEDFVEAPIETELDAEPVASE
jgi:hypothetical protein